MKLTNAIKLTKTIKLTRQLFISAALFTLTGCQLIDLKKINGEVANNHDEASRLAAKAQQTKPVGGRKTSSIEHVNGLWLPSKKVAADTRTPQNPALARKVTVNRSFTGIEDAAERITILTGIPVTVAPDAAGARGQPLNTAGGLAGGSNQSFASPGVSASNTIVPALGGTAQSIPTIVAAQTQGPVNLVYNGTLAGFLDVVAARYSVNWDWNKNNIRFFRVTSKTFRIAALPGDTTLSATVTAQSNNQTGGSSSGSTGTGTSGSGSSISSNNNQVSGVSFNGLSVWKGIEDSIKTMLTPLGKVVVTPATGTVSVTDTPKALAQVEQFIEQQNQSLGRQVAVNVRVLSVQLDNADDYGINWKAVYNNLSSAVGITVQSAASTVAEGAAALTLSVNGNSSHWAGSEAMIRALSTQGRVSQVTSATLTTLNNQPSPLQVGKQTSYLASSQTTAAGQGVVTTSLEPGVITTGFSMNLVPHILDDNKLLLQYAINLSELDKLGMAESGTNKIQTPEVSSRSFLQRVSLNSGDTLVVAGFEKTELKAEQQGVGNAENTGAGGRKTGSRSKTVIVVLLQPVIAN